MTQKPTKKRTTSKSRKKDEWTIPEFQMWFRTALDLQGEDWYPTQEQWEIVLDMVFKLKERQPRQQPQVMQQPMIAPAGYGPNQHNRAMSPHQMMEVGVNTPMPGQPDLSALDQQMAQAGQPGGMNLIPPSNDPLPPGIDNLEELRKQAELGFGVVGGAKPIKSAGNFGA